MSPAGRRTSAFYKQRKRQQRIRQAQTASFLLFCLAIVGMGLFKAAHSSPAIPKKTKTDVAVSGQSAGSSTAAPTSSEDAQLQTIIASWGQKYSFTSTVSVVELTGQQRTASLRADNSIVTASTFKLYVAYAVLHAVEQGSYSLNTVTKDGKTVSADLNTMILNSDNNAARTLGFMIGWPQIDSWLAAQGMTHTDTNNYVGSSTAPVGDKKSTAHDLSVFLQKLYAGQLLNATDTQRLLALLEKQNYRSGIPAGVPNGVVVANKPGWLTPADGIYEYIQNDAGIVYGPKSTYVIVITTTGKSMAPLADLSKQVYNYLEN